MVRRQFSALFNQPDQKCLIRSRCLLSKHCWCKTANFHGMRNGVPGHGENCNHIGRLLDWVSKRAVQRTTLSLGPNCISSNLIYKNQSGHIAHLMMSQCLGIHRPSKAQGHPHVYWRGAWGTRDWGEGGHEKGPGTKQKTSLRRRAVFLKEIYMSKEH